MLRENLGGATSGEASAQASQQLKALLKRHSVGPKPRRNRTMRVRHPMVTASRAAPAHLRYEVHQPANWFPLAGSKRVIEASLEDLRHRCCESAGSTSRVG